MSRENNIFHAETESGHIFKVLIEIINGLGFKRSNIILSKDGIFLRDMDQFKKFLFDVNLKRENFKYFKYAFDTETVCLNLNIAAFKKLIGTIKKKDCITFFIKTPADGSLITELVFVIKPRSAVEGLQRSDENTISVSAQEETKLMLPQHEYENADGVVKSVYEDPVVLNTTDMQKLKKPCSTAVSEKCGVVITIHPKEFISIYGTDEINKNKLCFGTPSSTSFVYEKTFETLTMSQISKITGFGGLSRFYAPVLQGFPLKIVSDMGSIGTFCIFLKDKSQIATEEAEAREKKIYNEEKTGKKKKNIRKKVK